MNYSGTNQTARVNLLFLVADAHKFDLYHVKELYFAANKCREEFRSDWLHVKINKVEPSAAAKKQFERRIIRPCFGAVPNGMLVCERHYLS